MAAKATRLKRFSPEKLRRLRGDLSHVMLSAKITEKTGVDINPMTLRKWEDGEMIPGSDRLAAVANFFGIPIDDLFE